MNTKGLELPLNTIVAITMVLLVLIVVGMMFFKQVGTSQTQGFDQGQCVSICQTAKAAHASQLPTGLCASNQAARNYCSSCPGGTCQLSDTVTLGCNAGIPGGTLNNVPACPT